LVQQVCNKETSLFELHVIPCSLLTSRLLVFFWETVFILCVIVLLYLAGSGIGRIGIVDFDDVDRSNLHRQVIHKDANVGMNKAVSACRAVRELNPTIECHAMPHALTYDNALDIVSRYNVVVDASDNPQTRYLINDACILSAHRPHLVSGSAMGTEGQLTVYGGPDGGACYRCLYPKPNASEGCKSCSDNGVLGPVPGLIGILQATEVLKVLTGVG
jgi:adenylyltransferase/sulfurtransferase